MKLNDIDKLTIQSSSEYPVRFRKGNKNYYVKTNPNLYEIIGEEAAKTIELECAHYEPLFINGYAYVASEDLSERGEFHLYEEYAGYESQYNLYSIWHILETNFSNCEEIMFDVLKMYLYDLLLINNDRDFENFGILIRDGKAKLVIFDNSNIFDNDFPPEISSVYDSDDQIDPYEDFENFITETSSEQIEKLITLMNRLNTDKIAEIIETIEKKYKGHYKNLPKILTMYEENYQRLQEIINKYRGEKNAR